MEGLTFLVESLQVLLSSSQVELEVPQLCSFILKTSQCALKEGYGFNARGKPLLHKTSNSEEFAAAMSK